MLTVTVETEELQNVPALEQALRGKILSANLNGETAQVTYQPVADTSFYINVWNCKARLVVETGGDLIDEEELGNLDEELLEQLKDQVIEENGGWITQSGHYYPQSDESVAMFRRLMSIQAA